MIWCRKCPKCENYAKRLKHYSRTHVFVCQKCRLWINVENDMIGFYVGKYSLGIGKNETLISTERKTTIYTPFVRIPNVLPLDVTEEKIKLILTFS